MLTSNQEREFKILQEGLFHAETSEEIDYYSDKIKDLLVQAKRQNKKIMSLFTEEQLRQFKKYIQKLNNAKYIGKVRYYGTKLHQLIDEVLEKGAYKKEYNLNSDQIEAYYEYRYKMKSINPFKSRYRNRIKSIIPEEILSKIESLDKNENRHF
jgi:phage baseplate assembly protein W